MKPITEIVTSILKSNNATVLAKPSDYFGTYPVTYANDTQAKKKAEELKALGINCDALISLRYRARYIVIHKEQTGGWSFDDAGKLTKQIQPATA